MWGEEEEVDQLGEGEGEFGGERADLDWGAGAGAEEEQWLQPKTIAVQLQFEAPTTHHSPYYHPTNFHVQMVEITLNGRQAPPIVYPVHVSCHCTATWAKQVREVG